MKLCLFKDIGDGRIECDSGGRNLIGDALSTVANCKGSGGGLPVKPKLGDITEGMLKRIGVTQDRYKAAKKLFGLSPSCNCKKRKEWLNRVSDWWMGEKDA